MLATQEIASATHQSLHKGSQVLGSEQLELTSQPARKKAALLKHSQAVFEITLHIYHHTICFSVFIYCSLSSKILQRVINAECLVHSYSHQLPNQTSLLLIQLASSSAPSLVGQCFQSFIFIPLMPVSQLSQTMLCVVEQSMIAVSNFIQLSISSKVSTVQTHCCW